MGSWNPRGVLLALLVLETGLWKDVTRRGRYREGSIMGVLGMLATVLAWLDEMGESSIEVGERGSMGDMLSRTDIECLLPATCSQIPGQLWSDPTKD